MAQRLSQDEEDQVKPSLLVGLRLADKNVLVIGGGTVGTLRVRSCLETGARVTVAASRASLSDELSALIQSGAIRWIDRYVPQDEREKQTEAATSSTASTWDIKTLNPDLVLSTIDDTQVSEEIAHVCRSLRIPVNCADVPALCDFYFTSVHRDGPLQIGVSTNGCGPKMASLIRAKIGATLPLVTGQAVDNVGKLRRLVRKADPSPSETSVKKRMGWLSALCTASPIEELATLDEAIMAELIVQFNEAKVGSIEQAKASIQKRKDEASLIVQQPIDNSGAGCSSVASSTQTTTTPTPKGQITLVGAGPGSIEYLTIAAKKAIETADLVLADGLIPSEVLDLVTATAPVITAQKHEIGADVEQNRLNETGLRALQDGKKVVRLKGGDAFLYGRGGEEVLYYRSHGFEPIIVPGVSSMLAAPALAGIPVTHRGIADQVLVLSGHGRGGSVPSSDSIPPFSAARTLVFLMSASRVRVIQEQLLENGFPASLPIAFIENASLPAQRSIRSTVGDLVITAKETNVTHPCTLVVGHVVNALSSSSATPSTQQSIQKLSKLELEQRAKAQFAAQLVQLEKQQQQQQHQKKDYIRSSSDIDIIPPLSSTSTQAPPPPTTTATIPITIAPKKLIEITDEHLAYMNRKLRTRTLPQILQWCIDTLPDLVQVTSFGATGLVIIDALHKLAESLPCIFLDTLYHFDETVAHSYRVEKHYGLNLTRYSCQNASTREEFERMYGKDMWKRDASRYDYLVKVEPLERALRQQEVKAWITGRRRDQGDARSDLDILEYDVDGRLKINPLAHWSWDQIWSYIRSNDVPYNPLHDKNFKSVGDFHSTTPVSDHAPERAGRFVGQQEEDDEQKTECGIHNRWKYVQQRGSSC